MYRDQKMDNSIGSFIHLQPDQFLEEDKGTGINREMYI